MGVFLRVAIIFSSFITELLELLIIHASQIINGVLGFWGFGVLGLCFEVMFCG